MIYKFPRLSDDDNRKLREWFTAQSDAELATYHSYKSCGNIEEATRAQARASTYESIMLHMTYHVEDDSTGNDELDEETEINREFRKLLREYLKRKKQDKEA